MIHAKPLQFLFVAFLMLLPVNAHADETLDRAEIEKIIREYLVENPEIMLEVQEALGRKQADELVARQAETIKQEQEMLFNSPYQIEFGNPDAAVTIVEFFDYNCGFCQRAMADMEQILESDSENVRFVLKEFPVLGEQSIEASRVSLAFAQLAPEKIGEFHTTLLSQDGIKDGEMALQLAVALGANEDEMRGEMEKPYIIDALTEVYRVAEDLGVTGTPSYIVGENVVFGAVGYEQLKQEIEKQQQQ
ncbi:MAG: DsbA family protein [Pseudomonadota bacterium]